MRLARKVGNGLLSVASFDKIWLTMLNVKLQRIGKRGQAYFRVVVAEHTKKPKGEVLEILGSYDPHKKNLKVKKDRVEYWISVGAGVSPTVNNLMVNYKQWDKPKMQSWKPKRSPKPETSASSPEQSAVPEASATTQ